MSGTEQAYVVVRNDEEQYSVWPAHKALPAGWVVVGPPGPREECLARIRELWQDLRPRSVREWLERGADR